MMKKLRNIDSLYGLHGDPDRISISPEDKELMKMIYDLCKPKFPYTKGTIVYISMGEEGMKNMEMMFYKSEKFNLKEK